jgi:hypothetical protein
MDIVSLSPWLDQTGLNSSVKGTQVNRYGFILTFLAWDFQLTFQHALKYNFNALQN